MENKPRLLMIVSRFPYPLEKGDKLRAYYQIRELSRYFSIQLIALSEIPVSKEQIQKLEFFCEEVHVLKNSRLSTILNTAFMFLGKNPFQVGYFFSLKAKSRINLLLKQKKPDYIYCQLVRTSEYVKNYHLCPKTIDYMDTLSKGMERRAEKSKGLRKWFFSEEAKRLKAYERVIFDYFEERTIISEQDRAFIAHTEREKIHLIQNGIDPTFFEKSTTSKTHDLVFVGNLSYAPNVEAVHYISNSILPKLPGKTCLISGATPHHSIIKLIQQNSQIELQGWIDDIREAYSRGSIFIAPMLIGTGMQNKLLEAMALGIPCITTTLANNAIRAKEYEEILVANSPEEFAQHVLDLIENESLYNRLAINASEFVKKNYSWEDSTFKLSKIIRGES
jgi:glycosyltransferase involved in cell wall biosynthesis